MTRGASLNPDHQAAVAELTQQGWTAAQIADRLGIAKRTVQRYRARAGIAQTRAPLATPAQIEQARALLADGCSIREAARTVGLSSHCIRRNIPEAQPWTFQQCGTNSRFIHAARKATA